MELTADRERVRVAVHEAAHVAAGVLLGRPVKGAWINSDGTGGSLVGTVKADREIDLATALDDLTVHLVADLTHPATASRYYMSDEPGSDEAQALDVAMRVSRSPDEARAVVALGRAKARTLAERPDFIAVTQAIASELAERGTLDADEVAEVIRIPTREEVHK